MTAHGSPDRVSLEALLAHRDWVRSLARRLVLDENDADDVEQETWRMAVERPPRHAGSLRAWLAVVVRNAARGSGRRRS
jgi:DNA-directed RNA polymerase specialized sigma24 family protein